MTNVGALLIAQKGHEIEVLNSAVNVSQVPYFQRNAAKETFIFLSKTVIERTEPGNSISLREDDIVIHVRCEYNGICGACVTTPDYPKSLAHQLVMKAIHDFLDFKDSFGFDQVLNEMMQDFDSKTCKIREIEEVVDETKIILHENISSILLRDENLDDLADRAEEMGAASKVIFKAARKNRACFQIRQYCTIC